MRFDDTNPAKEDAHFEQVILEDLKLLEIVPDRFTHTSDYFDLMLQYCEKMIKECNAYVDDTDAETMKAERDERKDSKNRANSVEKNLSMWEQMKTGSEFGQKCAVRAKIDMTSNNGCMRDPTIYRSKTEPHVKTGTKYKVYPTYDFACPIVDSIEGVTHALRTTEYHDRDEQFFWFLEKLELRKLHIYEYSRLNMNNTVLSKRKLAWFVQQGLVDSWDDPRFPTVRGILRRGMTVEGLKEFIIAQGSSRSVVNMEWDKIWSFNKKVIDAKAPRYVALEKNTLLPVNITNANEQANTAQKHPKDPSIGNKTVWVGPKILIESVDAELLKEGENATFINWGNLMIKKVNRDSGNKVTSVDAETNLGDANYKKTLKLTWLVDSTKAPLTPAVCVSFDHLINKGVLSKDEDFKQFIGHETRFETSMFGEDELKHLKRGDIVQLQRKGFFIVDEEYKEPSLSSCKAAPVVFFSIPDGHTKDSGVATSKPTPMSAKELAQSGKGKKAEKSPQEEAKPIIAAPKSASSTGSIEEIHLKIKGQGDRIRELKSNKADKNVVMNEVTILKELKASFSTAAGVDWTPDIDISKFVSQSAAVAPAPATISSTDATPLALHLKIVDQGNVVRTLKTAKADKTEITAAVGVLLSLKKEFKEVANIDWTPTITSSQFSAAAETTSIKAETKPAATAASTTSNDASSLHQKIVDQGNNVRNLKSQKADKAEVTAAVSVLLSLKKDFKDASGVDWTPSIDTSRFSSTAAANATSTPVQTANTSLGLHQKIVEQGNTVRTLKSNKADKATVMAAVETLLSLKKQFKESSNIDWTPSLNISQFSSTPVTASSSSSSAAAIIPAVAAAISPAVPSQNEALATHQKIVDQGNEVRTLKSNKAQKNEITAAVEILLKLKQVFKSITNIDWKPDVDVSQFASVSTTTTTSASSTTCSPVIDLARRVQEQGDRVRQLKGEAADKSVIKDEVNKLLALKAEFKAAAIMDWKPDLDLSQFSGSASTTGARMTPTPSAAASPSGNSAVFDEQNSKVKAQGDKVRSLKSSGADKSQIKAEVDLLLKYKKEFKDSLGIDWKPDLSPSGLPGAAPAKTVTKPKEVKKQPKKEEPKSDDGKKQTRLGLEVSKYENLSEWYSQVITKSDMIEYYNVSGCYILRPWSYGIWDYIKNFIDAEIKKLGVENSYFPIFVAREALEKEKDHIADFSPEVAWVTRSGSSELAEPIAIRPTSETVMYPAFSKWIQSHRDLPMKLNQWNNVVRWEFKQPTPFLRTREFLWQEGHTAFATRAEATEEVYKILDIYASVYEELLAIPVVKGKKTDKEKFAGGDFTTTTEAFVSASGRGIQGATSHHLGQNFSKMFDIVFEDPATKEKEFVYQNSWGLTTRTIGVMVMVHGDDKGLVLPPRVAAYQAIIMPVGITNKLSEEDKQSLYDACDKLAADLNAGGVRTKTDLRDNVTPAWKFNHWELKGVPLRLEVGPREVASGQVFVVRRDNGVKQAMERTSIVAEISTLLSTIQASMLENARRDLESHKILVDSWSQFCQTLDDGKIILAPFCGREDCEDVIKKESAKDQDADPGAPSMGAKSLCIPFQQPQPMPVGTKCIHPSCGHPGQYYCLFGRSY